MFDTATLMHILREMRSSDIALLIAGGLLIANFANDVDQGHVRGEPTETVRVTMPDPPGRVGYSVSGTYMGDLSRVWSEADAVLHRSGSVPTDG